MWGISPQLGQFPICIQVPDQMDKTNKDTSAVG